MEIMFRSVFYETEPILLLSIIAVIIGTCIFSLVLSYKVIKNALH